ncbi:MAG: hypothetical protein ACYC2G_07585 [Gemmatimonadaceae bacterium]
MAAPTDPPDPAAAPLAAGIPAEECVPTAPATAAGDLPPAAGERRIHGERRAEARRDGPAVDAPTVAGNNPSTPPARSGRASPSAAERRRANRRRRDRLAAGPARHDRDRDREGEGEAATRMSRRRERIRERRQERQLKERRGYWAEVRREVDRLKLEPFLDVVTRLAQFSFGPSATAMPHLRGRGSRRHMIIIVDAAHPEAITSYDAFEPLERQFWTAYGTIAKPAAAVAVAVRPARGWMRSEGKAPLFTQFGSAGLIS